ncbi:right-handed parallel beta-helix repeat-containing protein [Hydrogenoanaerobacterium sp.]|uniref:right-handed parallel beta-helix repeat-containing protein n=1 Tax=Hydrogenoanaerobacterium sp. TaxID=2953763 RepID=UPI00289E547A|nr:right-handed parallel beta-helix repeat-containing protein [Hydrogenoanaerobacterium sp.]
MQKGVCFAETGEMLRCVDYQTMLETGKAEIKNYSMLNRDYFYMELQEPIDGLIEGNVIENISWVPNVEISRCTFRNNRARGLLLTSAGNVLVEENLFQVPGAAILLEGDANNWFESGMTQNIVISGNTFDNCSYVPDWGNAPIQATPRYQKTVPNRFYHQSLTLDRNRFLCFDDRLLHLENVGRFCFTHNTVQKTTAFPPREGTAVLSKDCGELVQL